MANFVDVTRKLAIVLDAGTSSSGAQLTKSRTFAGLSETASADNVLKAGKALASLMANEAINIYIKDTNEVQENAAE